MQRPWNVFLVALFFCLTVVYSQEEDSTLVYYSKVITPKTPADLPEGYFYYRKQQETHLKNNDTLYAVDAQRMAAIASFKLGNFNESEQLAVAALGWLQATTIDSVVRQSRIAGLYNQLGKVYRAKSHYNKALDYYNLALKHVDNYRDSITGYNNRANVLSDIGDYDKASVDLQKAIRLSEQKGDTLLLARALNNLGAVELKQNHARGPETIRKALALRTAIADIEGMYSSNRHLALYARSEQDTLTAKRHATRSLELAKTLNSTSYLLESLSILTDLKNDPTVKHYKQLTDSINRAKQEEQNLYAAMRFDVEQEMRNTQRAELLLEKERSQKQLTQIIGILVLLVLGLLLFSIVNRIRHIKQREIAKTEYRISKKVHDEVANAVYQVMVKMQVNTPTTENLLDNLEAIYNRSRDISKEYSVLDDTLPFDETLTDLLAGYQSNGLTIVKRFSETMDWSEISQVKKNAIYRVLQELMTNMKKHSQATLVAVSITQKGTKTEILYSDNGVGSMLKKQNGLQNVDSRIFALNGSITFETEPTKGFKVKISV